VGGKLVAIGNRKQEAVEGVKVGPGVKAGAKENGEEEKWYSCSKEAVRVFLRFEWAWWKKEHRNDTMHHSC
jgi:hypothetical protein